MNEKEQEYIEKIRALTKHFKKLKIITISIWLLFNIAVDVTTFLVFKDEHIELFVFSFILAAMISTLIMVNTLNRQDRTRVAQENLLIEQAPLGKIKI